MDNTHSKLAGDTMSTPNTKGNIGLNQKSTKLVRESFGLKFQYIDLKIQEQKSGNPKKVPTHAMYQPNYNDFEFKPDEIKERMADGNMAKHIGIDTREIAQVDIDMVKGVCPVKLKWLYANCPYFLSVTKQLPHFLFESDEQLWSAVNGNLKGTVSKVKFGKETAADILHGIWSYAAADAVLYNAHLEPPVINVQAVIAELTLKSNDIEMCLPQPTTGLRPPVISKEKKNQEKSDEISELIATLKQPHVDHDEGRTFKSMAFSLKSHASDTYKYEMKAAGSQSTYCKADYDTWFERLWKFDMDGKVPKPITIGSFYWYMQQLIGKDAYMGIRCKYMKDGAVSAYRMACDFESLFGYDWVNCNTKRSMFDGFKWIDDTSAGNRFQHALVKHVLPLYTTAFSKAAREKVEAAESKNDEAEAAATQRMDKYSKLMNMTTDIRHMKETIQHFDTISLMRTDQDMQWNTNDLTFYFNNCVWDLAKGELTQPDRDDHVRITTGHDYTTPSLEQIAKVEGILEQIMPVPDEREFYLHILASSLTGRQLDRFIVANGHGGNGKSFLHAWLFRLLGHYSHVLNSATLCTPKLTELSPDLANLNDVRCARVSEPDERLGFNVSTMKTLTGDRSINARNLYEKGKQQIMMRLTLLCECNKKPKLEGQMDEAVLRRIVDMPFRSSFVSDPSNYHGDYVFARDTNLLSDKFYDEHRCALFHVLLPYVRKMITIDFNIDRIMPQSIKQRNLAYMEDSDEFKTWLDDHYEKAGDDFVRAADMFEMYREHHHPKLSKKRQREHNKKWFVQELQSNMFTKADFKERHRPQMNGKQVEVRNVLAGWREKQSE